VRATLIEALCDVLSEAPQWRDAGEALLRAMDDFEFADVCEETMAGRNFVLSPAVQKIVADRVRGHLEVRLPPTELSKTAA
jgi:hypothetical protein